jgi:hypothetical protein
MVPACVYYYGGWSASILARFLATLPQYLILDLSTWPHVPDTDIAALKAAGITVLAYIPTGGMRGFIFSDNDTTVKTPAIILGLIDQAYAKGFNGVFFDEGGEYTPVKDADWTDAYLDINLAAAGKNAGGSNPPILSIVNNSDYNPDTAESWKGLTCLTYINRATSYNMFICVGCPDEYARASRIYSNIFPLVGAVLTSEEYVKRYNQDGGIPRGQEIEFTKKCWVLAYHQPSFNVAATKAALGYSFGAAYCCIEMAQLQYPDYENYMAQLPKVTPPTPPTPGLKTFGFDSGSSVYTEAANRLDAAKVQNTAGTGVLVKLEVKCNQAAGQGKIRIGLYADNNGLPGQLLVDGGEVNAGPSWVGVSGFNYPVTDGTNYWIVFGMSAPNTIEYTSSVNAHSADENVPYGPLPNSVPWLTPWDTPYVVRGTVAVGAGVKIVTGQNILNVAMVKA